MTTPKPLRRTAAAAPTASDDPLDAAAQLWILRALIRAGGLQRTYGSGLDEDIADALDLPRRLDPRRVPALLQRRLRALESVPVRRGGPLFENAERLGEALTLTTTERELIAFAIALETHAGVLSAVRLTRGSKSSLWWTLARVLELPVDEVQRATRGTSVLSETRLLRFGPDDHWRGGPMRLMAGLSDVMLRAQESADALLAMFFQRSPVSALGVADFAHVQEKLDVIRGLLSGALEGRVAGVNVLVHGPPGTGKTELARVVTASVGAPLFEVCLEDGDGDAMGRSGRLAAYALAQRLLGARGRGVILFDEMEDAFPTPGPFGFGGATDKAWTNRLLEGNAVPTIWLSNAIGHIDPAFLRRFDLVVELRTPPRAVRRTIVVDRVAGLGVGEAWIDRAAADERMSPAMAARATRVARMIGASAARPIERTLDVVLAGALECTGKGARAAPEAPTRYDLALVNASVDVEAIVAGLARRAQGTVCLHGAPGTGKTAFARHIAERLGKPLLVKGASDLLGSFVGQTERAIAAMFAEARGDDAVLLLDEADGFLRDRAGARASWEVTQVNELLVQMEAFEGVFLCATNAFDSLDPASLRRFDLEVRFDALTAPQRWRMFEAIVGAASVAVPAIDAGARDALARLDGLTAGDFATVVRRARLLGGPLDPRTLIDGLEEAHRRKRGPGARRAGFRQ